jgi:GNAT superfamily N-acetyltransferase
MSNNSARGSRSKRAAGAVEVRPFEPKDEPQVLEVLEATFGQWPGDIQSSSPVEFFRWKHMAGPLGPSTLIVADADGAVIGCHAYMPRRLGVSGRLLTTMRGVDLAVHPSYRRRGISMAMRAAATFPGDAAFMWSNPNKQNRPGAHKAGMRVIGNVPRFVQPREALLRTVRRVSARGSKTPKDLRVEAETTAEVLRDGAAASLIVARKTWRGDRMATVKDLDYLRWRYGHFDEYRAIATESRSGAGGMVIFRARRHGPLWVADVCELLVEHGDRRTVRHLLRLVADAAATDFIRASFLSRHHAASFGFLQTRGVTTLMTLPLKHSLTPDPARRTSWELSHGDLELL